MSTTGKLWKISNLIFCCLLTLYSFFINRANEETKVLVKKKRDPINIILNNV